MAGRTTTDIKRALLELLGEKPLDAISMSEVAKRADVSRSTLYTYYSHVTEIYHDALRDFNEMVAPVVTQHACYKGIVPAGQKPLCALLREGTDYDSLTDDPRFVDALFDETDIIETHDFYRSLVESGYFPTVAKALGTFQISGCLKALRRFEVDDATWKEIKEAIDRFVCGGLTACITHKKSCCTPKKNG